MRGHIHKRVHTCRDGSRTTRWYVVIEIDRGLDGRRRQQWHGGFFTRREAEVARARLITDVHAHRYVARTRLTLEEWVRQTWIPMIGTRVKPTTVHGYRQMMEDYILPALGARPLQKLTTLEIDSLYAQMIRGEASRHPLSLNTVTNVHRALHKALADAVDAGLAVDNAASRAKAPRPARIQSPRVSAWTPAEVAAFLDAIASDRLSAVWRLAAMTGMRRGEILGLRWQDVDFDRRQLSVRRALVEVNYRVVESTPKGREARTVDLDWSTVDALAHHRLTQREEAREWGDAYEATDLVVAWQNGSHIHPQTFTRMFQTLIKSVGLRRIRLHDLRRTHATTAILAGVPITTVSERLGHQSPTFTLRQYAHALPGMQAPAAAVVAHVIRDCGRQDDEAGIARELRQPGLRTIDRGSEYQRLMSLFLSCVEQVRSTEQLGAATGSI